MQVGALIVCAIIVLSLCVCRLSCTVALSHAVCAAGLPRSSHLNAAAVHNDRRLSTVPEEIDYSCSERERYSSSTDFEAVELQWHCLDIGGVEFPYANKAFCSRFKASEGREASRCCCSLDSIWS